MPFKQHGRQYDLVVFGATGYTGGLTAEHITTHLPSNLKWAVAGRSESKLQDVVARCQQLNASRAPPEIEVCQLDNDELEELAKKTFVLITTVGPYGRYGEHAFKACAESGTHYLDVTGEVPFVARMIAKYETVAKATGAMMFPQIGIESAPPDLMTWSMAKILREKLSANTGAVNVSIHQLNAAPSGGTLATALGLLDHFSLKEARDSMRPYAISPIPNPRHARSTQSEPLAAKIFGVRSIPELGTLTTSVAGSTDTAIVHRSWGLLASLTSRDKEYYGPNFSFREFYRVPSWIHGAAIHFALFLGLLVMATPLRQLVKKFIYQPGQGPEREAAKQDFVEYRGTAVPDADPSPAHIAFSRAWFQGSMYYLSGALVSEAALTILEDDLELPGGVFTASCLGQRFIDRLDTAGFKMETRLITPQSS